MFITCSFLICQHVPWACDHNQGLHANQYYSKHSVQTITGCDIHLHDVSYSHYSSSNVRVRQYPQNGGLWINLFIWHLAPKLWVPAACLQLALKASTDKQCLLLKWCPIYASAGNLSRNLRRNHKPLWAPRCNLRRSLTPTSRVSPQLLWLACSAL